MIDKNKLVINSVFQILIIFAAPVFVFLLIKYFLPLDLKNNKIVNIIGIFLCYFISWFLFFVKIYPSIKNKVSKDANKNNEK